MVNNNGIPIEVKKPFETVYELKNEIPSFEEFMKTYENDANLNYADLSGGSVGEVKGYGPCSPSYCNSCSCSRSDCNCRSSEKFVKLWSVCPATTCPGRETYRRPSHWVHSSDGRYTWISNQARIRCESSYCSTDHMKNWRFRCSAHNGVNDYRSVDRDSFEAALGWAMIMKKDNTTNDVIRQLNRWIDEHPGEWY